MVYFVSSFVLRHVKIGFATDLAARLKLLQTGNPAPLYALAYCSGTLADERLAHEAFEDIRGNGEWFARTPGLDRTIRSLQLAIADQHGLKLPSGNPWDTL